MKDLKIQCFQFIPIIALQISALTHGGAGVFGRFLLLGNCSCIALIHAIHGARKGFDSRDAVTEPTWMYSPSP
ncbi:MAG: hypothetical protein CVV06_07445 [Gammaproteobacteria bacterium HGW-Gammaproteobacteria-10]|nr:MAG: hypothetical protein CVV06_07445 [Gammaproteobacteria bacterium HGW-Gammaproteobacteria-10]